MAFAAFATRYQYAVTLTCVIPAYHCAGYCFSLFAGRTRVKMMVSVNGCRWFEWYLPHGVELLKSRESWSWRCHCGHIGSSQQSSWRSHPLCSWFPATRWTDRWISWRWDCRRPVVPLCWLAAVSIIRCIVWCRRSTSTWPRQLLRQYRRRPRVTKQDEDQGQTELAAGIPAQKQASRSSEQR